MTILRPLAYGYMRIPDGGGDQAIQTVERALQNYAESHGYCFATTFYESASGSHAAFHELTKELQRANAHHVIVPSTEHLARNLILQAGMLDQLEREANATVIELGDA